MQKNSFCEGGTFHQFIPNSKSNSHCHLIVMYFELHPRGKTSTIRLTPPKPTMKPENLDLKKEKSSPKPSNHPYHPFFRLPQNLKNFQGYKLTPPPNRVTNSTCVSVRRFTLSGVMDKAMDAKSRVGSSGVALLKPLSSRDF